MKILYLSNIPSPYRVDYFNELGKTCDLTVVYQAENNSTLNSKWFSEDVRNFKAIFLKNGNINEKNIQLNIVKYIKRKKYDLIVASTYSNPTEMLSILLMKLKGIPFILEVDGGMPKEESYLKKRVKTFFIGSAKYWLSTSKATDKYLTYYGAKEENIFRYPFTSLRSSEVLENPLDYEIKRKIRAKLGLNSKKIALAVGQFIYRKGFDILINSWENIDPSYQLIIIGDGELKSKLIKKIKELGITNITILDFMDKKQLINYYNAADIFVLPTREDIWGLVINEAMANALPVITTDRCVAGIELVKENENGFIIPIDNPDYLASKIIYLLENDKIRGNMSRKSLEKIKKYTIENMTNEHIKTFKEILDRGRY
ncbi:glycosyltransferase family 4 protein [Pseudoneobacillus sp. C159]